MSKKLLTEIVLAAGAVKMDSAKTWGLQAMAQNPFQNFYLFLGDEDNDRAFIVRFNDDFNYDSLEIYKVNDEFVKECIDQDTAKTIVPFDISTYVDLYCSGTSAIKYLALIANPLPTIDVKSVKEFESIVPHDMHTSAPSSYK